LVNMVLKEGWGLEGDAERVRAAHCHRKAHQYCEGAVKFSVSTHYNELFKGNIYKI
jgi:hypothetical protein